MSLKQVRKIAQIETVMNAQRALFWLFALIYLALTALVFTPLFQIGWGDGTSSGGTPLARNSELTIAIVFSFVPFIFTHLIAAAMTDPVVKDYTLRTHELLFVTPVTETEYILGKFLGSFFPVLLINIIQLTAFIALQRFPLSDVPLIGFRVLPFLKLFVLFPLSYTFFIAALCYAAGTMTKNPKLVYAVLTVIFVVFLLLLDWVGDSARRIYQYLDVTGTVWLINYAVKDRGTEYLNAHPLPWDYLFLLNRVTLLVIGGLALVWVSRRFPKIKTMATSSARGSSALAPVKESPKCAVPSAMVAVSHFERGGLVVPAGMKRSLAQTAQVIAVELRLLLHERSLYILVLLIPVLTMVFAYEQEGPFNASLYPISSLLAQSNVNVLLVLLFGTAVFFTTESLFRESEEGVLEIIHAQPVKTPALLAGKVAANLLLSLAIISLCLIANVLYQASWSKTPIDLVPFALLYGFILIPTIVYMTILSLALGVFTRNKYAAYAVYLLYTGILIYLFVQGHRNWLYNAPLVGLYAYSDMTKLDIYRTGLTLHRIFYGSLCAVLFSAAAFFYSRSGQHGLSYFSKQHWRRHRLCGFLLLGSLLVCTVTGFRIHAEIERGLEANWLSDFRDRYEMLYKDNLKSKPQLEFKHLDLAIKLHPEVHSFRMQGRFFLTNNSGEPVSELYLTFNPRLKLNYVRLERCSAPPAFEEGMMIFRLDAPVQAAEVIKLEMDYEGTVPSGILRSTHVLSCFIQPNGTYLHSLAPFEWLPVIGYYDQLENPDQERKKYGREKRRPPPRNSERGQFGITTPFTLRIVISVPRDETGLSAGELVEVKEEGSRRIFTYRTDHPIYFFPLLSARYKVKERASCAVYYNPVHPYNVDAMLDALVRSREFYSRAFSAFPFADLRIAEFPNVAPFAMGYPTLIPFAESIGFLTEDTPERPNLRFYITAHETAHQWWGTIVWPARAKGSAILTEGLANFSALLMVEQALGRPQMIKLLSQYENDYLHGRVVDLERPLVEVDGHNRGDDALVYNKAAYVFYMLMCQIGRERLLRGLREYIECYSFKRSHPTIRDLIGILKHQPPEGQLDWFYDQWFGQVVLPDYWVKEAVVQPDAQGYKVEFKVENLGTGKMPVTVEISGGDRESEFERKTIWIGSGSHVRDSMRLAFKPAQLTIDPDREVLDFNRQNNSIKL